LKRARRRTAALALLALLPFLGLGSPVEAKHAKARKPTGGTPTGGGPILVIDSGGPTDRVNQLLFTHDGRFLISAGDDKVVRVWSLESGEAVRALRGPIGDGAEGRITALALSPDDRYLAVGGIFTPSGDIRLYDFASGQAVALLQGH
jgi:WD40 repeat protein